MSQRSDIEPLGGKPPDQQEWLINLGILAAITGGIYFVNSTIVMWKTMSAQLPGAYVLDPNISRLTAPLPLALITQTLTTPSVIGEPIHQVPFAGAAGIKVTQEEYRRSSSRRGRSGSWRHVHTSYTIATPLQLGPVGLTQQMMQQNGDELWQSAPESLVGSPAMRQSFASAVFWHNQIYPSGSTSNYSGNRRYVYRAIMAPQKVTVLGTASIDMGRGNSIVMTQASQLPENYPALWPGEQTTESILDTMKQRLINTLAAVGGALFLAGWAMLFLTDKLLFWRRPASAGFLAAGAAAATAAGVAVWYQTAAASTAIPTFLGLYALVFLLGRVFATRS